LTLSSFPPDLKWDHRLEFEPLPPAIFFFHLHLVDGFSPSSGLSISDLPPNSFAVVCSPILFFSVRSIRGKAFQRISLGTTFSLEPGLYSFFLFPPVSYPVCLVPGFFFLLQIPRLAPFPPPLALFIFSYVCRCSLRPILFLLRISHLSGTQNAFSTQMRECVFTPPSSSSLVALPTPFSDLPSPCLQGFSPGSLGPAPRAHYD